MSDFKFNCPKCDQSIICDASNAGMQIPCPVCQTTITVPRPAPAAPTPPTAGKLSINKAAHKPAAPAPVAAPTTGVQSAYGARNAPPARRQKKFPWVPISVTAGILIVAAVGWFGFGAPYLKQQEEKKKQAEEAARLQQEEQARAAAEAAKAKIKPTWKADLAGVEFPKRPATGKHHGADFTVETASFASGSLALIQTAGSPHQFVITLPLKTGETVSGKTYDVAANNTNTVGQPRVTLSWKDDTAKVPGIQTYKTNFSLKLEFGTSADGKLPGRIYLCLPDPEQSFVAGTFEIGPKTAAGQAAPAPGAASTRRRGS